MEGKCRFDASPFSVSGMLYYIYILFLLRQRIAILPYRWVISLITNVLWVWQFFALRFYLPYIAIKSANIGILEEFWGEN